MPDLTPEEVQAQLSASGLAALDNEDLEEITHRINAVREALDALELPELDAVEEMTVFEEETPR